MSDEQKAREDEVFDQKPSLDDLDAAAGGDCSVGAASAFAKLIVSITGGPRDDDRNNCINHENRNIYGGGGFPNCAATVGDGSYCSTNDACHSKAVDYGDSLRSCYKAWQ